ncbi:alpha-amylase family protein [Streptomyces endophyticus]|uniref:Alpha-amylase family glycosyl hydrolase n=1 Tax=Streptomyces endophyticus TaxID=714166 RepID=A0ABU6EZJ5_9ACTN|nr:alpha-amylase family glycosyl hydrolase [Streptomyces endophyticus]MEB8337163.1 alpha-amylase family glycosyl hydrolase [Streptomyces endophyticus]
MAALPTQPVIHEVNTRVWLRETGRRLGREIGLADVPKDLWDELTPSGVDIVWLMGVWERSPQGRAIALQNPALRSAFEAAVPGIGEQDIAGSPYCIRRYEVDGALGGAVGLTAARAELDRRGVGLLLDYVPNHVAPDNPWVGEYPELFVRGDSEDLRRDPDGFLDTGRAVLARGRDPFFPPWPDVVQLNAFAPELRRSTVEILDHIGRFCDGVRCDMAMLLTNDVFQRTWGERAGQRPVEEFWVEVIGAVHRERPDMLFAAEAYWDLEWALQQQGFDFCYDKRLYDRILAHDAASVRAHLHADETYQRRLVRFLENHDEPRAAHTLPPEKERAAAALIATLPGATLWHEGQFTGRRVQLPVFLDRRPDEPVDDELRSFHERLLSAVHHSGMRTGSWRLLDCAGWPDNDSAAALIASCWTGPAGRFLTVVNLSDHRAQARIHLPWPELGAGNWQLTSLLGADRYERSGAELLDSGLYVDLAPWGMHLLAAEA